MQETQLTLKTVADLRRESIRFVIDTYQRGFRWTQAEVRDLLSDVREFSRSRPPGSSSFYCLQPVVVTPAEDGASWKVIDGQQRLTTLFLFYCCCSWLVPLQERYNMLPFSISYMGKPRVQAFLKTLSETEYVSARRRCAGMAESEEDIDCYYLLQAYQCIGDDLQALLKNAHTRNELRNLRDTFETGVKLIWYQVGDCDAAGEAALFTRLNTGKIRLTNAELVKALLLERKTAALQSKTQDAKGRDLLRNRIAVHWDEMEAELRNPKFWNFLTGGRASAGSFDEPQPVQTGEVLANSPTRLDLLLQVLAMDCNRGLLSEAEERYPEGSPWKVPETIDRERFSFYVFSAWLRLLRQRQAERQKEGNSPKSRSAQGIRATSTAGSRDSASCFEGMSPAEQIWDTIQDFYGMLRIWYENPGWYHRVGFLLLTASAPVPETLLRLRDMYREVPPDETLRRNLWEDRLLCMIREELFGGEECSTAACREWVTGLIYPKDSGKIRQVLLLYNLFCMESGGEGNRFPLELYRSGKLNWDIDHINAIAEEMPGDDRRDTEVNGRRQWLETAVGLPELEQIITADGRRVAELIPELLKQKSYLARRQTGTRDFVQVYEAVIRFFGDSEEPDHSIGNLTLLDGGINRTYRNDVFPVKRKAILEYARKGVFIPPGTEKVFMKGFRSPVDWLRWREEDKKAYTEELIRCLCEFLKLESRPEDEAYTCDAESAERQNVETPAPYVVLVPEGKDRASEEPDRARVHPQLDQTAGRARSRLSQRREAAAAATRESLWSLLSGRGLTICIPPIQRDYAQGRPDMGAAQIREKLLRDLSDALRCAAVPGCLAPGLDLGFVYGNLEARGRFVPVDGQQRLTTLFLLHWLLSLQSGKLEGDPETRSALLRFRYETRESSSRFLRELVMHPPRREALYSSDGFPSEQIQNLNWYSEEHDRDPTVRSCLVMLDALQEKLKALISGGIPAERMFEFLTSDRLPVHFLFLNLDDAGLSDSIYIKMNARGRPLTLFESFKAALYGFLKRDEKDSSGGGRAFSDIFLQKLNGPWMDFFWRLEYRREGIHPAPDTSVLRFFRFMILADYMVYADAQPNGRADTRADVTALMRELDEVFFSRLFGDGFREVEGVCRGMPPVTAQTFRELRILLDLLQRRKREAGTVAFMRRDTGRKPPLEELLFRRLIGAPGERPLNIEERVLLYAEYTFLLRYVRSDGSFHYSGALKRWMRVVSNLIRNSWDLQADHLPQIFRALHSLTEGGFALHCERSLLKWPRLPEALSVFPASQVREECMKAALKQGGQQWRRVISEAERVFPGGRIDMLFDFAGITAEKLFSASAVLPADGPEYSAVVRYLRRYRLLFNRNGVRPELEKEALLRRALLCCGGEDSYLLPPGKVRQCFLDNSDRDVGFRRLLRDENAGRRRALKELLDDLDETASPSAQLRDIIRRKMFSGAERWKEYLVTMPEILSSVRTGGAGCADPVGEWVFQNEQRFIRRNHEDDILLLSRTQTSSVNREYYSYVLFLKARQLGLPVYYHTDYTDGAEKYAWFESRDSGQIQFLYRKSDDAGRHFLARRADTMTPLQEGTLEEMLEYIAERAVQPDTDPGGEKIEPGPSSYL